MSIDKSNCLVSLREVNQNNIRTRIYICSSYSKWKVVDMGHYY
jgi:hypothetical protein